MKLLSFAAAGLLALSLAALAEEAKPGMSGMGGMSGMNGPGGMSGMGGMGGMGMPGMSGMGGGHMHHPVQSTQGSGTVTPMPGPDQREVILLSEDERNFVLTEMRNFLDSVQGIIGAVAEGKPKDAGPAALRSGMHVMRSAPQTMMGKMPMEFRMLGMDTHQRFAAIAEEASAMADEKKILRQLSEMLANCSACHQGYRISVK